jgi:hypothetical protein
MGASDPLAKHVAALQTLQESYDEGEIDANLPIKSFIEFLGAISETRQDVTAKTAQLRREMEVVEMQTMTCGTSGWVATVTESGTSQSGTATQENLSPAERIQNIETEKEEFVQMRPLFQGLKESLREKMDTEMASMDEAKRTSLAPAVKTLVEASDAAAAEIDACLVALIDSFTKLQEALKDLEAETEKAKLNPSKGEGSLRSEIKTMVKTVVKMLWNDMKRS